MPVKTKTKKAPKKKAAKKAVKKTVKKAVKKALNGVKGRLKPKAKEKVLKKTKRKSAAPEDLSGRIQQKAYEIFERRGYSHGYNEFDWNVAESLVRLETQRDRLKSKKRINFDDQELSYKIEQKAYELFAQKGCRHGDNEMDWYLAESLVRLESE